MHKCCHSCNFVFSFLEIIVNARSLEICFLKSSRREETGVANQWALWVNRDVEFIEVYLSFHMFRFKQFWFFFGGGGNWVFFFIYAVLCKSFMSGTDNYFVAKIHEGFQKYYWRICLQYNFLDLMWCGLKTTYVFVSLYLPKNRRKLYFHCCYIWGKIWQNYCY